jgi:glutamate--cysteine ligase
MTRLLQRLQALPPEALRDLRRGIEKESLRVNADGSLAATPHPAALGSALTHEHITTDFSEAQLELITGVHPDADACAAELAGIQRFVQAELGAEMMWCASMPCRLPAEDDIPIALYGTSNVARAKTVYRIGLSHRYGRRMQTISGIHYNFSLPEAAWPVLDLADPNTGYFALIRNFQRHAWLLFYLFGASPAVCSTFVDGRAHELVELSGGTLHLPHATTLRMGRLGYLSEAQDSLSVSCNDLASYTGSLQEALTTPYPAYEKIGIRVGDDYRQLATTLLQIENEFYSTIRPKRVIRPLERPLHALRQRGVQYVEVRAMDLDPFVREGISTRTMRFLDVFLLHCLLSDSPPDTPAELRMNGRNKQLAAARGREPGLRLERGGDSVELRAWAGEILEQCGAVAAALDAACGGDAYRAALRAAVEALRDPSITPSARVLAEMRERHGGSHGAFVLAQSIAHRDALAADPLPPAIAERYARVAAASLEAQRRAEAADHESFETFRNWYLSAARLTPR